jgi:hypothetical protein
MVECVHRGEKALMSGANAQAESYAKSYQRAEGRLRDISKLLSATLDSNSYEKAIKSLVRFLGKNNDAETASRAIRMVEDLLRG